MADNRSERFNNEVDLEGDQMPRRYTDPFEGKLGQRIIEEKLKKYERDLKKTRRDIREIASDLTDNYDLDDEQAQSIAGLIESMSNHTHNYSDLEGTPDLAAVATSGSYNDLDDKPTIPDVSGKANSADLAAVATSGSYNDLDNKPTIPAERFHTVTEMQFSTMTPESGHLYIIRGIGNEKLVFAGSDGNYEISLTPYSASQI